MPIDPAKPFDLTFRVDPTWDALRLDRFIKAMVPAMSRTKIQKYVKANRVEVNSTPRAASWKVREGDEVLLRCNVPEEGADAGKRIPLDILYEDDDILVVNKQPGLVVHPVALHRHDTLLNALYWRYKDVLPPEQEVSLANRLDRDTSGVILVTKHTEAKQIVQEDFEARRPDKAYLALCEGAPPDASGVIDLPIGPAKGRTDKCLMGIRHDDTGKPSRTDYALQERFEGYSLVRLQLHTGRQHQIRVHMQALGCPLVCDNRYGDPRALVLAGPDGERCAVERFTLHAAELSFDHPRTRERMTMRAPLAEDLQQAVDALRAGWTAERVAVDQIRTNDQDCDVSFSYGM